MLKTYITTVPLQGKLDPMLYQRERAGAPTVTCFPIVQVMRDTLEPGDTVQLLAIRQENAAGSFFFYFYNLYAIISACWKSWRSWALQKIRCVSSTCPRISARKR